MYMKVSGVKTKHMATVYIITQMEQSMRENGEMISKRELAEKSGQIRAVSKECTKTGKSTDRVNLSGLMGLATRVNGRIIKCTGKECSRGQMDADMRENMIMIESMDLVYLHGLMGADTRACGEKVNRSRQMRNQHQTCLLFLRNQSDQINYISLRITQYNNKITSLYPFELQIKAN